MPAGETQPVNTRARRTLRPLAPVGLSDSAQRVLEAALELFNQHGYDGTSLQLIADRLGVTKAAIYYHFRTKNEILGALVRPAFEHLQQLLDDAGAGPRTAARREQNLRDYIDYLLHYRQVSGFLSRDIAALAQPEVWQPAQQLTDRLQHLLTGHAPQDDEALADLWGAATSQALIGALLAFPAAPEEWLRSELTELGAHLAAGHRKAQRRAVNTPR